MAATVLAAPLVANFFIGLGQKPASTTPSLIAEPASPDLTSGHRIAVSLDNVLQQD